MFKLEEIWKINDDLEQADENNIDDFISNN